MRLSPRIDTLHLTRTFSISGSSRDDEPVLTVELEHDGLVAHGEGAPVDYWGETPESMLAFVGSDEVRRALGEDPFALEEIGARLAALPGSTGAKMALDGALHDWVGRRLGVPVWRLLGLSSVLPPTSFTIGLDSLDGTVERVEEAKGFEVLKVKVGGPDDLERLRVVRAHTAARLRIDGNEGWTYDTARELMPELRTLGVEYIEQPFPVADVDGYRRLRELPDRLPVFLDESVKDAQAVAVVAGLADGVNLKLSKTGGIREAVRAVHVARAHGLAVMIGCMIESELGIAQSAAVASLADHVDLDGALLISGSRYAPLELRDGRVVPLDAPGLGVEER